MIKYIMLERMFYFRKGLDYEKPEAWTLNAHPEAACIQYFEKNTVKKISEKLKKFNALVDIKKSTWTHPSYKDSPQGYALYFIFNDASDEANFIMWASANDIEKCDV